MATSLFELLQTVVNKLTTYNTKIERLTKRFHTNLSDTITVSYPSGFSKQGDPLCRNLGGSTYTYVTITKSSNWSTGNITNTVCANFTYTLEDLRHVYTLQTVGMGRGGLKNMYASNTSTSSGTTTKAVTVTAVGTADTSAQWGQGMPTVYNSVL